MGRDQTGAALDWLYKGIAKNHRTEVRKGDVWQDLDKRMGGRQVVIENLKGPLGKVVARQVGGGKPTHITRERLEKGQGWDLVSRAPEGGA